MLLYQCWYIIELLLLSVFLSTNLHLAHRVPIAVDALERRRQGLIMQGGRHARVWRRRGGSIVSQLICVRRLALMKGHYMIAKRTLEEIVPTSLSFTDTLNLPPLVLNASIVPVCCGQKS